MLSAHLCNTFFLMCFLCPSETWNITMILPMISHVVRNQDEVAMLIMNNHATAPGFIHQVVSRESLACS